MSIFFASIEASSYIHYMTFKAKQRPFRLTEINREQITKPDVEYRSELVGGGGRDMKTNTFVLS